METINPITIWIIAILALIFALIYFSTRPSKCPKCGGRMEWKCRAKFGREVHSLKCPYCGYEEILNVE